MHPRERAVTMTGSESRANAEVATVTKASSKIAPADTVRRHFLAAHGYAVADNLHALPSDASARRYYRIASTARGNAPRPPALLMEAPPPENLPAFIAVAHHLTHLGLRAPRVYATDEAAGLALVEDFGDDTFTRLLDTGRDEYALYHLAVDALLHLHKHPEATALGVPPYDVETLVDEALLLMDWFYPEVHGAPPPPAVRRQYTEIWRDILQALPRMPATLVLRDFHVDNLIEVRGATPLARCGLLDFQDARQGSPAYDLMSLLEDARRDVNAEVTSAMRQHYLRARPQLNTADFNSHYTTLAAQRHCKVIGIFTRLHRRDGKPGYTRHLPRVRDMLNTTLSAPRLAPLRTHLASHRLLA